MMERPHIEALVLKVLRELSDQKVITVDGELSNETSLFGREGILDSVGLVSLVVAVEQAIEDEFGTSVSLADEKALSQRQSPYRTVRSLAEYAARAV